MSTCRAFVLCVGIFGLVNGLPSKSLHRMAVLQEECGDPTPEERAKELVSNMTLDEKVFLLHGDDQTAPYVGNTIPIPRLSIPSLRLEDGPQGVGDGVADVTCFPSLLSLASSFDVELMERLGKLMGQEQRGKGTHVHLGPGVAITRVPVGGRNFEYLGEDPYLARMMAAANVRGVQSEGVIACAKHFADNHQEGPGHNGRLHQTANVDERTHAELYMAGFEGAIAANVGSVMCSYNLVNNTYACENSHLLTDFLKNRFGFAGFVVSDWGATHSTVQAVNSGLDQQMSESTFFGHNNIQNAVSNGTISQQRVDDMAVRVLTQMIAMGIVDHPERYGNLSANVRSDNHTLEARMLAEESTILLQNENDVLPLSMDQIFTIGVIGDRELVHGSGSGAVFPPPHTIVSVESGIALLVAGTDVQVLNATVVNPPCTNQCENQTVGYSMHQINEMIAVAQQSDVVVVSLAIPSGEAYDRADLQIGWAQQFLMQSLCNMTQKTKIVVVRSSGVVMMSDWSKCVDAILLQLMPGEQAGMATADILFGVVNPSAKLPITIPAKETDTWLQTPEQYPGVKLANSSITTVTYTEELLVGYRWFDAKNVLPLFPFGHGLSYTTFVFGNLALSATTTQSLTIAFDVVNKGPVFGKEVAQLYLSFPVEAGEPPLQLKAFQKIALHSNEDAHVEFVVPKRDLSVWSVVSSGWVVVCGKFGVSVGASSRDIRLTGSVLVPCM